MTRFITSILLFISICVNAQIQHFNLTAIVTDDAEIMTPDELASLKVKLTNYETKTTNQIVVLTINSLGNNTIETYAEQVFNQNKLGQKNKDNGLLILFSKNDRKVRIEVGYGFEPIITDALSSRIIREIMIPEFKKEQYYEGINLATSEIIKLIDNPEHRDEFSNEEVSTNLKPLSTKSLFFVKVFFYFVIFLILGCFIFLIGKYPFKEAYTSLTYCYRGLIIGKISIFSFPFVLISSVIYVIVMSVFILMLLGFMFLIFMAMFYASNLENKVEAIFDSSYINKNNFLILVSIILVIIPLLRAFLMKSYRVPEPFRLSFRSNKKYISKHISGFGSSSYTSGSNSSSSSSWSSSSSSSSFSGGGGSSGGGGASGSW